MPHRTAGTRRWVRHLAWLAVVGGAFALRLYRLGAGSLWYDETVSLHLAGQSLPALVAHTAGDIHPPGYYLLLHAWTRLAGRGEFAAAFFSLVFGLILVALAGRLAGRVYGRPAGLLAALLVALSPYNLWYSQEVRMYTLGAVLAGGLLLATLELLPPRRGRPPWPWLALYAALGAASLWTLYYAAFLLLALNLLAGAWWLVARRQGRSGWRWLGGWAAAQAGVLLLYAPWLPVAWRQATAPPVPPWRTLVAPGQVLVDTWSALSLGQSAEPAWAWPALLLFGLLFLLGLLAIPRLQPPSSQSPTPRHHPPDSPLPHFPDRRESPLPRPKGVPTSPLPRPKGVPSSPTEGSSFSPWLLAGSVFLPVLFIYLASFLTPLYHVRYVFTYSLAFYVVAGGGLALLWSRRRWLAGLSLVLLLGYGAASIHAYHAAGRYAPDDHRAAVHFLARSWRPGDAVLVDAGYAYTALLSYWDGPPIARLERLLGEQGLVPAAGEPVLLLAGSVDGDPGLGWGNPEADFYAMTRAETAAALDRLLAGHHRVWLYRIYDTVTDPDGFIRGWLAAHGRLFEDRVFAGEANLRVQGYVAGRDPLADTGRRYDAALAGGALALTAGDELAPTVEVGGALDLALVWTAGRAAPRDAVLFAGLFDADGRRWAQVDERPLGSLYPAAAWSPGSLVRTPLRVPVPVGTPPGSYRVEIGWYRFEGGQPVWLAWEEGDRLLLGQVQVVAPRAGWAGLSPPAPAYPAGVTLGAGVRLLGFDAPRLAGRAGEVLALDLFWLAEQDHPEPGLLVLQLADDAGQVVAEQATTPAGGRAPFAGLAAGQVLRDPQELVLPAGVRPGVYNLRLGRRQPAGAWLPVRRGPFPPAATYPLATVHVQGRPLDLLPPQPGRPAHVRFGDGILLVGYDLVPAAGGHQVTLYWQALAPMASRYKIFVHLVGAGGPADIRAQADVYPHLPTTGWVPGEYLADRLALEDQLADGDAGPYCLLLGLYDEIGGTRLPAHGADDAPLGDAVELDCFSAGE